MNLAEYLEQEASLRPAVHRHDGIWWRKTSPGGCQPLYTLQEIPPGRARPSPGRSFIRYSHVVPAADAAQARRTRPRVPSRACEPAAIHDDDDRDAGDDRRDDHVGRARGVTDDISRKSIYLTENVRWT